MARVGGTIYVKINGVQYDAKGSFTYNFGIPKREPVIGPDGVHGYKEMPQVAFVEGIITDNATIDVYALQTATDAEVTIELANGKNIALHEGYYAHDGGITTEEGEIPIRYESRLRADEV